MSLSCKLSSCKLSSCELSFYNLSSCKLFLLFLALGREIILISCEAEVDLRSTYLIRAHFDGLSSDMVSKDPTFSYYFLLHVS